VPSRPDSKGCFADDRADDRMMGPDAPESFVPLPSAPTVALVLGPTAVRDVAGAAFTVGVVGSGVTGSSD